VGGLLPPLREDSRKGGGCMFRIVSKSRYDKLVKLESLERRLLSVLVEMHNFDRFLMPLWKFLIHGRGEPATVEDHFDKELKRFSAWLKKNSPT
jgi:hypothetical protein